MKFGRPSPYFVFFIIGLLVFGWLAMELVRIVGGG
jgi:hypothetical protein